MQLAIKGVDVQSILYPLCKHSVESVDHALFHCPSVEKVWKAVAMWCEVQPLFLRDADDLLSQETLGKVPAKFWQIWEVILCASAYSIWHARNKVVIGHKNWSELEILSETQIMSHL